MRKPTVWLAVAGLLACSDASEPTPPMPEFAVSPARQWAGGTVLVRSASFIGQDPLPTVIAAGVEMVLTRVDDSTVSAILPSLPTQTAAVEVVHGATHYPVGDVGIVGFRALTKSSPQIAFWPVVLQSVSGPMVVSGVVPPTPGGAIGLITLRTATTTDVTGVAPVGMWAGQGPGASFAPNHLILKDSAGVVAEWQILPTLVQVDTAPTVESFARNMARLSETVWLQMNKTEVWVWRHGAIEIVVPMGQAYSAHLSVAADRAVLSSYSGGIVFEMSTGDTLYRLPVPSVAGAVFTPDGSTLYVTSGFAPGNEVLAAVNAADGSIRTQASFQAADGVLALDGSATRLFVSSWGDGGALEVLILDALTLSVLGRLQAAADADCEYHGYDNAIVVDDATATVFVVESHSAASNCIWEFDMLP